MSLRLGPRASKWFVKASGTGLQSIGSTVLIAASVIYCLDALRAPFFGGLDALSNLLPIIHYRHSIIVEGHFPWYTNLWYGGRCQWMNPLWSFLYPPATAIWLIFPLEWGTRIILCGHLVLSALAGRRLAKLLVKSEIQAVVAGLLFTAPIAPAMMAGHFEKVMSWPWMLAGLCFLLDTGRQDFKRGMFSGICLGVIALTGANYYVLYTAILYCLVALSFRSRQLLLGLLTGSLVGAPHLPTVLHLIGQERADSAWSIAVYSSSALEILNDLFLGLQGIYRWEDLSIVGLPTVIAFYTCLRRFAFSGFPPRADTESQHDRKTAVAVLVAGLVFLLLATGTAYRGHHFLDAFRVPSRATAYLALTVLLFICLRIRGLHSVRHRRLVIGLMAVSALHVAAVCWSIRPQGARYWIDNSGALALADLLQCHNAHAVWMIDTHRAGDGLVALALNTRGIQLPNVYYGDMGQSVPVQGELCGGYSFDYMLADQSYGRPPEFSLRSAVTGAVLGKIPAAQLRYVTTRRVADRFYDVYQVVCDLGILSNGRWQRTWQSAR